MLFENEIAKVGYLSRSVPEGIDLKEAILKMKIEKNAVILAHYYVSEDIQSIADFVGDSLALAQASKKQSSDIIVFCGVHFMAETAKILNPNSKVLLPDLNAGCSLADSAPESEFIAFKNEYHDAVVVSYINCSSEIKALSDQLFINSATVNDIEIISGITSSNGPIQKENTTQLASRTRENPERLGGVGCVLQTHALPSVQSFQKTQYFLHLFRVHFGQMKNRFRCLHFQRTIEYRFHLLK